MTQLGKNEQLAVDHAVRLSHAERQEQIDALRLVLRMKGVTKSEIWRYDNLIMSGALATMFEHVL